MTCLCSAYEQSVLRVALKTLCAEVGNQPLLMWTIISTLQKQTRLKLFLIGDCITERLMPKFIEKEMWKDTRKSSLWEGLKRFIQMTKEDSFCLILEMPAAQIPDMMKTLGKQKAKFMEYAGACATAGKISDEVAAVLGIQKLVQDADTDGAIAADEGTAKKDAPEKAGGGASDKAAGGVS